MQNIRTVIDELTSDKVKKRQEALVSIRGIFSQDAVVTRYNTREGPDGWSFVLGALYSVVGKEVAAYTEKSKTNAKVSSAAAQRRLGEAAATLRWLTEQIVRLLNWKVVQGLLHHLLTNMVYCEELFSPVALDYIKTLKCLMKWTPHLEHLSEDYWIDIVEMGIDVVLGDPIVRRSMDDTSWQATVTRPFTMDNELLVSDKSDRDEPISVSTQTKKRRHHSESSNSRKTLPNIKGQKKPLVMKQVESSSSRQGAISLEQTEFMSLLSILLRSHSAPLLSTKFPGLAPFVLNSLERFIIIYPSDTSLYHDYLLVLSATLSHISLNKKHAIENFVRSSWNTLVGLWGTKNRHIKEVLVVVLRMLFPFLTMEQSAEWEGGIRKLWQLLDGEADSRWGTDGLSLKWLRLEIVTDMPQSSSGGESFVTSTFRAGWGFDAGQALAWAILELQADCAEKLFQLSETAHNLTPASTNRSDKRLRIDDPIATLLASIRLNASLSARAYHLQVLLFIIDRHWAILITHLKQDIIDTLMQFVSFDDGTIQSWVFMCFTAIFIQPAGNDTPTRGDGNEKDAAAWDGIWTHAIRRVNVPAVCRAACYTAHALLINFFRRSAGLPAKSFLTPHRVLLDVESLAKDLDVQGPIFPYDSVCSFLADCLRIASQDVRLYRMQFEDKVLSWLVDCWRVTILNKSARSGGDETTKMPPHNIRDILLLLENICALPKQSDLVCRHMLPECMTVENVEEAHREEMIRNFVLHARLPPFKKAGHSVKLEQTHDIRDTTNVDVAQPRTRERKISTFLLKSLEYLVDELDSPKSGSFISSERYRTAIDLAVVALVFEALLILNGTRATRRVTQCACKVVIFVCNTLTNAIWTAEDKALILLGLEPLISTGEQQRQKLDERWQAMLPPSKATGIQARMLKRLAQDIESMTLSMVTSRRDLQRILWQSTDVQDTFSEVVIMLKNVLHVAVGDSPDHPRSSNAMDIDDGDGFAPIRITKASSETIEHSSNIFYRCVAGICISFIAMVPVLQSSSGESTRDRALTQFILDCAELHPDDFIMIAPIYFDHVCQKTLSCSLADLEKFSGAFNLLLKSYNYAKNNDLQRLIIHFVDSTMHMWLSLEVTKEDVDEKPHDLFEGLRKLFEWISIVMRAKTIGSWLYRDSVVRFLDRYLHQDPSQTFWLTSITRNDGKLKDVKEVERYKYLPSAILPTLTADEDIRVRFRVAVVNARLFALPRTASYSQTRLYDDIREHYTADLGNYEHMLTRILSLGNIMIASSAVRRGPYWHLLEAVLYTKDFTQHIEIVLRAVAERMGLSSFSDLFEAYASQIAFSICESGGDFLRFPPQLLGYTGRAECAIVNFSAFAPVNVSGAGRKPESIQHGRQLFLSHCKAIQKDPSAGIRECFADIVGSQILTWIGSERPMSELDAQLKATTWSENETAHFEVALQQNTDGVVLAILRALNDRDISENGPIVQALREADDTCNTQNASSFLALVRHRLVGDIESYEDHLPSFDIRTVLKALTWTSNRIGDMLTKPTSYHVMHEMFSVIQGSPLVNEQIRMVNALSIWIAWRHQDFSDPRLLYTLIRGATSLLAQPDLARAAQSLLEWAFRQYRHVASKDSKLADVLIRISSLAHIYAIDVSDAATRMLGSELLLWIDGQALKLCKSQALTRQVMKALSAWPQQPSDALIRRYEAITSEDLSAILSDRITSNKFRLVRRLRDLALSRGYAESQFVSSDFWRLKECIPQTDQIQDEDIDAFAGLLILNKGRIHSFGNETAAVSQASNRYNRKKKGPVDNAKNTNTEVEIHHNIVIALLQMLDMDDPSQVYSAYRTLRLLVSLATTEIAHDFQSETDFLKAYPRDPHKSPVRYLDELATSDGYLNSVINFSQWIGMITTLLSDILSSRDAFYAQLRSILHSNIAFAEQILPSLVHALLQSEPIDNSRKNVLSAYFSSVLASDCVDVSCLRAIIGVVLHLRNFSPFHTSDALAHDKWLTIDYTLLARSAISYGAYTTALLFLELAAEYQKPLAPDNTIPEEILFDIYSHIDEPDGFYGIKTGDLHKFLIKRFHHEKQWDKAFQFHGAALEAGNASSAEMQGLLLSFHSFGFDHLASGTLQGLSIQQGSSVNVSDMSYQLGWRTETWDLPDASEKRNPGTSLYLALRAIHCERDPRSVHSIVRQKFAEEMARLHTLGDENLAEIREVVQNLMCLSQVNHWRGGDIQSRLKSRQIQLDDWIDFINIDSGFEFSYLENIMATRISLIRSMRQKAEREQIGNVVEPFLQGLIDIEKSCLVRLSEAARDTNHVQIALNSIVRAQKLEKISTFEVSQEFASVLWFQKEQKLAIQFLTDLVLREKHDNSARSTVATTQKALLLGRLGTWTAEACLEKPTDIQLHFFDRATSLITDANSSFSENSSWSTVYRQYAMFAERQYQAIVRSPDAIRLKVYVERKKRELSQRQSQLARSQGTTANQANQAQLTKDQQNAEKQLKMDEDSYRKHMDTRVAFLGQAIDMYSRCLETSDDFDDDGAIRLFSLWFANFDGNGLQGKISAALDRVPSGKIVFLAHQLTARLSKPRGPKTPENQVSLQKLVLRMCKDHPFHSLYQVYCLRSEQKPSALADKAKQRRQSSRHEPAQDDRTAARTAAALDIFDQLRNDPINSERVRAVERVCLEYLKWATHPIRRVGAKPSKPNSGFEVPEDQLQLVKVNVPIVTVHTPIDQTLRYDNCIFIDHYDRTYTTAGGVNLPKINICYGNDGKKYKQLFKGEGDDDLRQDAVMEQVFDLVNGVLRRDRETQRRNLSVRGYKVIPLSATAGVIEFVADTTPLNDWIHKAHSKYHPDEIDSRQLGVQLGNIRKECGGREEPLVKFFLELCKKFHPVMRHYFIEQHKTPMSWFAMRLRYTRSVATTSIVGHILGLGDRHVSNILIDNRTGEVVHIDLGIAFEQGKSLPIPERVPFRMTRDMVDGMGSSGTQGVFQRCAEETLRVLREGSGVIMTVLEVFKHDPLHSWTASEVKVKRAQGTPPAAPDQAQAHLGIGIDMDSGTAEEAADRALSTVARKLDGALSVEYTVNALIAEATDTVNLATIYHGWSPHL